MQQPWSSVGFLLMLSRVVFVEAGASTRSKEGFLTRCGTELINHQSVFLLLKQKSVAVCRAALCKYSFLINSTLWTFFITWSKGTPLWLKERGVLFLIGDPLIRLYPYLESWPTVIGGKFSKNTMEIRITFPEKSVSSSLLQCCIYCQIALRHRLRELAETKGSFYL